MAVWRRERTVSSGGAGAECAREAHQGVLGRAAPLEAPPLRLPCSQCISFAHEPVPTVVFVDCYHAAPVASTQDPQDLPVEKLLEHFTKGDSASALVHRRVLNDIGVTTQSAPNAASVRAAGPLSGRRSKPPAQKPAGGNKVGDGDLLTSMVQRLNALERKMAEQRNLLVEKDAEIAELRARQEERNDDARLVAELTDENIKLKRRQLEMEKFLADYGLGARAHPLRAPCARIATTTCITLVLVRSLGWGRRHRHETAG